MAALLALIAAGPAAAQSLGELVHIPLLVNFAAPGGANTGGYDAGGESLRFLRVPVSHAPLESDASRRFGLRLRFETSIGVHDFADLFSNFALESIKVITLLPGIGVPIRLGKGAVLVPFLDLGTAHVSAGVGWKFLGRTGVALELETQRGDLRLLARPGIEFIFSRGTGTALDDDLGSVDLKLGARHPLPLAPRGHRLDFGAYTQIEFFFVRPALDLRPDVEVQYEIGTSLGTVKALRLKILDLPRLSAGYRFGDGVSGLRVRLGGRF